MFDHTLPFACAPSPEQEAGTEHQDPPLTNLKVVDLSRVLAGPFAAMILGDLGAQVIKIERPGGGDDTRTWGPPFVGPPGRQESTYFLSANRNKRSVVLDLQAPEDLQSLKLLLQQADVVIENFRPGVMDRLGLSEEVLHELNPQLICLSISGFGSLGPDRTRVGYDQILQAEAGLMGLTGLGTPTKVGVPTADLTAGLFGIIGVLAALLERVGSRQGQHVHTSLLAGLIGIHTFQATRYLIAGEIPAPAGNHHPTVCPYGMFVTADAPVVLAVGNENMWRRFAPLVALDPADDRFRSNSARLAHFEVLEQLINTHLQTNTIQHWMTVFNAAGIPAGEVKTLDRVYTDPQLIAEGLITQVQHPTLGPIQLPGNPLRFSRSTQAPPTPPPLLGQHTEQLTPRR